MRAGRVRRAAGAQRALQGLPSPLEGGEHGGHGGDRLGLAPSIDDHEVRGLPTSRP
jgi:hypothetical protein